MLQNILLAYTTVDTKFATNFLNQSSSQTSFMETCSNLQFVSAILSLFVLFFSHLTLRWATLGLEFLALACAPRMLATMDDRRCLPSLR